jgi:hypothetical protein
LVCFSHSVFGAIGIRTITLLKDVINVMHSLTKELDELQNFGKA